MSLSDVFGLLGFLFSIGVFVWTLFLEKRLRRQASTRETFDIWIATPAEASFQQLAACLTQLAKIVRETPDHNARVEAVRSIQKGDFEAWFFELDALCEAQSDTVLRDVREHADPLVDGVLEFVNELADPRSEEELRLSMRTLAIKRQRFISNARATVQAARLRL